MQTKKINKIIFTFIIAVLLIITSNYIFASVQPRDLTGNEIVIDELDFVDKITDLVRQAGTFIAVGVLMILGIKYMMGSVEERATYKKSMMPYIIGCLILFGAVNIVPQIKEIFTITAEEGENASELIGNKILGLIQVIGTFVAVGILMILGIKYMMGSAEEKASYKKSMVPYIVGAVLLFAAVNIVSMIYDTMPHDSTTKETTQDQAYSTDKGGSIRVPK